MQHSISQDGTSSDAKLTRALLFCGIIAGPLYIMVGGIEMLTRPGFDPTRDDLSLMSNGDWGWIHISMFILTGLLTCAGAVGMRRRLSGSRGGTWGPLLVGLYGLGLICAGFFSADPAHGFPPGTPADAHAVSWHGLLHFICGGIGFLGLIAACFVFARRFAAQRLRGWTLYSVATGVFFFAAFVGIAVGSNSVGAITTFVILAFTVAVVIGWAWVSVMSMRLLTARA
jgi:drug/metabolite transporter (DMT)-like permease